MSQGTPPNHPTPIHRIWRYLSFHAREFNGVELAVEARAAVGERRPASRGEVIDGGASARRQRNEWSFCAWHNGAFRCLGLM